MEIIDHYSRLVCHLEWFFNESSVNLLKALSVAIMKLGHPRRLLSDNGAAMRSEEYIHGLKSLGIKILKIKAKKPYQNGKTEVLWGSLESKFLSMLVGQENLDLEQLNELATAWTELGYNQSEHREIKCSPLSRYISGTSVGLSPCDADTLKRSFRLEAKRSQRCSDHTITIENVLFRIPEKFWANDKLIVRYARWDLSFVHIIDYATGKELQRIFPVDKESNADGIRRNINNQLETSTQKTRTSLPPYILELLQQYRDYNNRSTLIQTNKNKKDQAYGNET